MGFFNHRSKQELIYLQKLIIPNAPNYLIMSEHQLIQSAYGTVNCELGIIKDCEELINTTKNPEVYFSRFDLLIEKLQRLIPFEPYVSFAKSTPTQALNLLYQKQPQSLADFLNRYLASVNKKVQTLKTEKGRNNQYIKFRDSLRPYYNRLNQNYIDIIESQCTTEK